MITVRFSLRERTKIVAAVFLACGQDPAQVVESANCITLCEAVPATGPAGLGALDAAGAVALRRGGRGAGIAAGGVSQMAAITAAMAMDLHISVTMPSIEVGTWAVARPPRRRPASTSGLPRRGAWRGAGPGDHAGQLGKLVAAATLAGELSLLAASRPASSNPTCSTTARRPEIGEIGIVLNDFLKFSCTLRRSQVTQEERERHLERGRERERKSQKRKFK